MNRRIPSVSLVSSSGALMIQGEQALKEFRTRQRDRPAMSREH
jgi:hypothetical protein